MRAGMEPKPFDVGDRVYYAGHSGILARKTGTVTKMIWSNMMDRWDVRWRCDERIVGERDWMSSQHALRRI